MNEKEQISYIKNHYLDTPIKRMAKIIGRSSTFIYAELKRQNLSIPKEVSESFKMKFKKGIIAWNKGIPQSNWMSKDSIERIKATQFKKGNLPHNTKSDFEISIRKDGNNYEYLYIRTALSKWEPYHRYLWALVYGKIPEGNNIQFKDGNSLNVDIGNLYMVNRRNQSLINKMGGKAIPFEFHKTIDLIKKIKDKQNEKQNN